jgi:predicted GNAT family acetyltransferase
MLRRYPKYRTRGRRLYESFRAHGNHFSRALQYKALMIRILGPGDEGVLEAFLATLPDTSMFLRSNARAGGLEDRGERLQATYAAAFDGGAIVAVAAHCWNGMLLVQAPQQLEAVVRAAISASARGLKGIAGAAAQVRVARDALGVGEPHTDQAEMLFSLDLAALRIPDQLSRFSVRHPRETELPTVIGWRQQYLEETGLGRPGPGLREEASSGIRLLHARGDHWVLEDAGAIVSYTAFNARLPEIVQVGGVWTPPGMRRRGYARCAVAGSLVDARAAGVTRAILFSSDEHAVRAYQALGFVRTGDYGLLII